MNFLHFGDSKQSIVRDIKGKRLSGPQSVPDAHQLRLRTLQTLRTSIPSSYMYEDEA
jgi:hypothetical protein